MQAAKGRSRRFGLVTLTLLLACGDATGPAEEGGVRILLTDAPSDYIESATVQISRIVLVPGGDGDDGRIELFADAENPLSYDLMTLRDGLSADLTGVMMIPEGSYRQLRIVVDDAVVVLAGETTFADGSREATLKTPSAHSSGIKVGLTSAIESTTGETVTVLVDFDVDDNFVLQGNPETPAGIRGILFRPVLRETSRSVEPGSGG